MGLQCCVWFSTLKCGSICVTVFLVFNDFIVVEVLSSVPEDWCGAMGVLRKWLMWGYYKIVSGFKRLMVANLGGA